ncbi:hypothetical protein E2P81_ATG02302 [Venturia nashicola]|uniref:Uncharacterized protein n=1 Tax=Venturia nashicola TaxID=86259 RepID=A0A4Z1P6T2_9PEZI|nr:hypothetical protein E6O75_ATG02360 [Venturia nashicola]TLD36520.1 hypothetical protein E2P81_ATG02302 [Venturia nashicola]
MRLLGSCFSPQLSNHGELSEKRRFGLKATSPLDHAADGYAVTVAQGFSGLKPGRFAAVDGVKQDVFTAEN